MTPPAATLTGPVSSPASRARQVLMPIGALMNVMVVSAVVAVSVTAGLLVGMDGWTYYGTALGVRGYHPAHPLLRPSGPIGQTLGVAGAALMLVPFVYMVRKRFRRAGGSNLKRWLEVHIFCGIVGPVLVTFHTAFKFNGIVSAAYWSMVLVALSGFVGRYLYVRIPRTIRGVELSQQELDERTAALKDDLQWTAGPDVLDELDRLEADLAAQSPSWFTRRADRELAASLADLGARLQATTSQDTAARVVAAFEERARLQQRRRALASTKRLFDAWHVFHLPLVWVMFVIVTLHVGVALYLGYVPFRW